jgi:hypothetical protein
MSMSEPVLSGDLVNEISPYRLGSISCSFDEAKEIKFGLIVVLGST